MRRLRFEKETSYAEVRGWYPIRLEVAMGHPKEEVKKQLFKEN